MTDEAKRGHEQNDQQRREHSGPEGYHEHRVRLVVKTHLGGFSHDFKTHDLLQYVADLAAEHFHWSLPPGDVWELRHGERSPNLSETIGQSHPWRRGVDLEPPRILRPLDRRNGFGGDAHDFRPQDLVQHVANLAAEHFQIALPPGDVWRLRW